MTAGFSKEFPEIVKIVQLYRHLMESFLDIGTELPTVDNTHELAQQADPTSPCLSRIGEVGRRPGQPAGAEVVDQGGQPAVLGDGHRVQVFEFEQADPVQTPLGLAGQRGLQFRHRRRDGRQPPLQ
ncbi:SAM-dependent methyltransferase [Nonomuraea sp. NEAU-A123]|nr:SAM-dependent methyltransferase [Nonomuraea sp. NEAU-A123]